MIADKNIEMNFEDKELVTIVNQDNEVIGAELRKKMREQKLIHRGTYIYILQSNMKYIYVQKRALTKRYCPGYYDACFGGVVAHNESYDSNAQKEIFEEVGLLNQKLISMSEFLYQDELSSIWGKIYYTFFDGNIDQLIPQPEEVQEIIIKEIGEVINSTEKWTPDGIQGLKLLIKELNLDVNNNE